jgi:hypothetical protein
MPSVFAWYRKIAVGEHLVFFSLYGGVRLSPLGTPATAWPIVSAPDDG